MQLKRADFPQDFLFGAATSSYQIEGHAHGGAGLTEWDTFAATPGNVVRHEDGARACDHYTRYEEDLDLLKAAHFDVYRFSTSWARVLPEGTGAPNAEGLDFYDRVVDALLARDLKPALTLYHWELPVALADKGGWRNADMPKWFGDYTETVMTRLGDRIWSTAPINEPWCVGWLSHFLGLHAPGLRDIRATARAMHHILVAHGTAIQAMRALGAQNLGAVCNFEWATPLDETAESLAATETYDAIYNRFFIEGLFKKRYPEAVLAGLEPHLPTGWQTDFDTIATPIDWLGLNYYTRKVIGPGPAPWPALTESKGDLPQTQMGWEIYPDGLYDFLKRTASEYTGDLPLYVTENGMANADHLENGQVNDQARIDFLDAHLGKVHQAISEGVPVKGYYTWSLLDNYEWALGYEKRFGLVHIDFNDLKRTPKASYHALAQALSRS